MSIRQSVQVKEFTFNRCPALPVSQGQMMTPDKWVLVQELHTGLIPTITIDME